MLNFKRPTDSEVAAIRRLKGTDDGKVFLQWLRSIQDEELVKLIYTETSPIKQQGIVSCLETILSTISSADEIAQKRKANGA